MVKFRRSPASPKLLSVTIPASPPVRCSDSSPMSLSAPLTMGADNFSPKEMTVSLDFGVSSPTKTIPVKTCSSSQILALTTCSAASSNCLFLMASFAVVKCLSSISCLNLWMYSRFPFFASSAAWISWFVTPSKAETTATTLQSLLRLSAISLATWRMFLPFDTDVPPNFITIFFKSFSSFYFIILFARFCFMSSRSLNTALAVSIPPAPRPIMVCSPADSETKVTALSAPSTARGSCLDICVGSTFRVSPMEPMSFIVRPFLRRPLCFGLIRRGCP